MQMLAFNDKVLFIMMLYCAFKVRGTETFTTQTLYNVVFFKKNVNQWVQCV